ncbi:MAG: hypothetical protein HY075_13050 [Deltaproteobacteria bacterium]|nr:hypothetical protein [Deltaproteobacteria bacterium]
MAASMVVVTGPDGSGKSTACAAVVAALQSKYGKESVASANIWDSMEGNFDKEAVVRYLGELDGAARVLFLFHALKHSVDLAQAKEPKLLLVDSYFYKYAAAEFTYGTAPKLVLGAAAGFEKPELTICLDLDAETALQRKGDSSRYESGGGKFTEFQKKMRTHWAVLESQYGPWTHVPAADAPEVVAAKVIAHIEAAGLCKSMR